MGFKVFTKAIALALVVLLCVSSLPVFGLTYSPGPIEYELNKNYLLEAENAEIASGKLVFNKNGRMKFDLLLPFDAVTLELSYETLEEAVNFAIKTDENAYKTVFKENSSKTSVAIHELCKSNTITFTADKPVTLTGVKFIKVDEQYNEYNSKAVPYSKYEEAILTLVGLKAGVGAVKTRGTILRWDTSNIYLAPKNINGSIYVPLSKFAEVMGYYCEDYQDLSYVYLLGETQSLTLKNGKGYYEGNGDGKKAVEIDIRYEDGYTWAPVRAVAEVLGFTVDYKDGYVLIGDRLRVKEVFESRTYFSSLQEEMEVYSIPKAKTTGKTYHVAQTLMASDANNGSEALPFATIQKAADIAKAGDTVIIHEGTYRETVTPKNDGTVFAPITFIAAEGEKVTISALEPISGFTKYKGDILCTPVHNDLAFGRNQLFYKGEALNAGRHPNEDTKPNYPDYPEYVPEGLYPTRGNIRITEEGGNIAYSDTDLDQEKNYWQGGSFITLKGEGWSVVGGEIVSSDKGMLELKDYEGTKAYNLGLVVSYPVYQYKYFTKVHDSDYGYITNHINTVDIPGEWFMQDNVMYMIPPEGADLNKDFEIKERMLTIDLRDRKYVTVKGINTIGGGITVSGNDTEGCVLDECNFRYIAHHSILYDQTRYTLYPDEAAESFVSVKAGEAGICFDGKYNSIVNSTIDYSSATSVTLLGKYHYVNNNVISNTGYSGGTVGGIWITSDNDRIEREGNPIIGGHYVTSNTVYNGGRAVMHQEKSYQKKAYPFTASEIAYNRFFNGALCSRDTGIVYEYGHTGGTDILKTRMHHNFVYNTGHVDPDTNGMIFPLYHDGLVSARDTYSNVIYYQDEDLPYTENYGVWVASWAYTVCRSRNNSDLRLKPNGEFDLTRADFPGARPFLPGSDHGQFARRYMDNYEDFVNNNGVYFASKETVDENGKETFVFDNVKFEDNDATQLFFYLNREYGKSSSFNIVARIYDEKGNLVKEAESGNSAYSGRFYVNDVHRGLLILDHTEKGTYRVEIEIPDSYTNLFYMAVDNNLDTTYDNLYTKKMEESGVVAYLVESTTLDEEKGTETFRVEDVPLKGGVNTRVNLHATREQLKDLRVNVTTNVFDQSGNLVSSTTLINSFKNAKQNQYEVINGTVIIPKLEEGVYDIEFEFADTYCQLIRIMTEEAEDYFDYLYNNPDLIMGGAYDDFKGSGQTNLSGVLKYTPEKLQSYEYFPATGTWNYTIIYKDKEIKEDSNLFKIRIGSGDRYAGSVVKLYVDSMETEPVATFTVPDTGWKAKTHEIPLDQTITAGKHTFYLKFEEEGTCTDLYYFSFGRK